MSNRRPALNTDSCDVCGQNSELFHDDATGLAVCEDPTCSAAAKKTTKGTKQIHRSHKNCAHPKTPAARAKCRKAGFAAKLAVVPVPAPELDADDHFGDTPYDDADDLDTSAYDRLTANQKNQAAAVISNANAATDKATMIRLAVLLAAAARAKKTTIAKLSKNDLATVFAFDAL